MFILQRIRKFLHKKLSAQKLSTKTDIIIIDAYNVGDEKANHEIISNDLGNTHTHFDSSDSNTGFDSSDFSHDNFFDSFSHH